MSDEALEQEVADHYPCLGVDRGTEIDIAKAIIAVVRQRDREARTAKQATCEHDDLDSVLYCWTCGKNSDWPR